MFFENWNFGGHEVLKLYFKFQKIEFLELLGHQNINLSTKNQIFGRKVSYLIFEAVNFWGFWGPEAMGGTISKKRRSFHWFSHKSELEDVMNKSFKKSNFMRRSREY